MKCEKNTEFDCIKADMEQVRKYAEGLMKFIDDSPTAYQVVDNISEKLAESGYKRLKEGENTKGIQKGFYIRNGSSLIAYNTHGASDIKGFRMICSHSDSPAFKLKAGDIANVGKYKRLNVEKYGGMLMHSWFDRPLSVAGRVAYNDNGMLKAKNVNIKKPSFIIPNLAIHMSGGIAADSIKVQSDMLPVTTDCDIYELIERQGVNKKDILGMDLYVYNTEKAGLIGDENPMLYAPRIDNLLCAYTSINALISAGDMSEAKQYTDVVCVFDNEEVGSLTRQGAASDFLMCSLLNILDGMNIDEKKIRHILAESFLVSADNAHALHPSRTDKADPVNRPLLNEGIVIKYHGGQKYTTDAISGAVVNKICRDNNIPVQLYYNNSDVAGGSTLGNILQANISVMAADIGVAQLAMHSAMETAGATDAYYMYLFMKEYLMDRGCTIDEKNTII